MAELKPEQQRVKSLLIDTVTLLCKNSLQFDKDLSVEGLLGVSIDHSDVFFVHISKNFQNDTDVTKRVVQSNPGTEISNPQYIDSNQTLASRHKRQRGPDSGTEQGFRRMCQSDLKNSKPVRTGRNGNVSVNIIKQEVEEVRDFEQNGWENGFTAAPKVAKPARIIGHRRYSSRQKSDFSGDESTGWISPKHSNLNTSNGRSSGVDTGDHDCDLNDDIHSSSAGCNESPAKRRSDFLSRKSEDIESASVQSFQPEITMTNEVKNEYFIGNDSQTMAGFVWSEHVPDEVALHHVSDLQAKQARSQTGQSLQDIDASSSTWCQDLFVTNKIGDEHDGQEDRATCPICGKSYSKKQNMLRHRQTHYYQNGYVCPVCKKGFKRSDVLRTHMRRHKLQDSSASSSGLIPSRPQTTCILSDK